MNGVNRKWTDGMAHQEDWWAVWLGLIMFFLGLLSIWGIDAVGWMAKPGAWSLSQGGPFFKPSGKAYAGLGQWGSLAVTYIVWTALVCIGAYFQRLNVAKFWKGWTLLFIITYVGTIIGHEAHLAVPEKQWAKYGITWGLQLGGDGTVYMLCLAFGLIIGNFIKPLAEFMREACKPEWYIKTAIVYLGIKVGVMSMEAAGFAFEIALAGACATFVAYLLFWPIIYVLARKMFRLPREWAAVLCSGISICGVSAAIATGGAIRAKPIIAVMVSMLIVVYAMIELLVLPSFYTAVAPDQPIVNGAAMGMTVKTDGADAAAGAILDELMVANAASKGVMWQKDWILAASIMTKDLDRHVHRRVGLCPGHRLGLQGGQNAWPGRGRGIGDLVPVPEIRARLRLLLVRLCRHRDPGTGHHRRRQERGRHGPEPDAEVHVLHHVRGHGLHYRLQQAARNGTPRRPVRRRPDRRDRPHRLPGGVGIPSWHDAAAGFLAVG